MGLALQSLIRAQPESSAVVNICASVSLSISGTLPIHFVVRESGLTSRKLLPPLFCVRMYISHEEVCWGHSPLVLGHVKSAASKSLMVVAVVGGL